MSHLPLYRSSPLVRNRGRFTLPSALCRRSAVGNLLSAEPSQILKLRSVGRKDAGSAALQAILPEPGRRRINAFPFPRQQQSEALII